MSIAKHQVASLQAMGIDVYKQYYSQESQPAIVSKAWFSSLLDLLDLRPEDCQFSDSLPISFDPIKKILVLPFTLTNDDAALKKRIWQHIKGDVKL